MRTAKEYIEEYGYYDGDQFGVKEVSEIINKARKEAIEECAKVAKSEWVRWGEHMGHQVDKQSILSLINELK